MRVTFVSAVLAVLAFLGWLARDAHLAALREAAEQPWTPPAHVWGSAELQVIAAEPGGAPFRYDVCESMCGMDDGHEQGRIVVAPQARANARSRLGMDPFAPEYARYEVTNVRQVVGGVEWRRCDAVAPWR